MQTYYISLYISCWSVKLHSIAVLVTAATYGWLHPLKQAVWNSINSLISRSLLPFHNRKWRYILVLGKILQIQLTCLWKHILQQRCLKFPFHINEKRKCLQKMCYFEQTCMKKSNFYYAVCCDFISFFT